MIQMTLQMAEAAVRAAQDKAKALGTPMTVTVVDEAGRLVLSARGDGTGFFTPETSRAKAVAAAAFKRSNKELAEMGFGTVCRSTSRVRRLRRPASSAALRPKTPPPTTMRSKVRPVMPCLGRRLLHRARARVGALLVLEPRSAARADPADHLAP